MVFLAQRHFRSFPLLLQSHSRNLRSVLLPPFSFSLQRLLLLCEVTYVHLRARVQVTRCLARISSIVKVYSFSKLARRFGNNFAEK